MWTYLAIFASITALIAVFVRRLVLTWKKGKEDAEAKKTIDETPEGKKGGADKDKEDKAGDPVKKKSEKSDQAKIAALIDKAEMKLRAGKEDDAIKLLVQALAVDESNENVLDKLAKLYMKKQMYSAASALFKQLAEISDESVHFSHLGLSYYQQQEYEEAKKAYQRAVMLDDSRPQRFVSLGQVYRALGQMQNAIIAINKALEKEENIDFMLLLADVLKDNEDLEGAIVILEKAKEIDPENEEIKALLKEIKKLRQ